MDKRVIIPIAMVAGSRDYAAASTAWVKRISVGLKEKFHHRSRQEALIGGE